MGHTYTLSIQDPWNLYETEDFESETPFQSFNIGDEVDTRYFESKLRDGAKRVPCRVTKVIRFVGKQEGRIYDSTIVHVQPIE